MKKALILGCSFTSGSYEKDLESGRDYAYTSLGWYDYISCLKKYDTTVYGFGGCGYQTFSYIIHRYFVTKKLKQFDLIIIQETFDPRISILDIKFINKLFDIGNIDTRSLNITSRQRGSGTTITVSDLHNFTKQMHNRGDIICEYNKTLDEEWLLSDTGPQIVVNSKGYIETICEMLGIPVFVFSMGPGINKKFNSPDFWIQRLPIQDRLYHTLIKTDPSYYVENVPHPHQTLEGNKVLGQTINNALNTIIKL